MCKGPPISQAEYEKLEGPCPHCNGFYRFNRIYVREDEVDGVTTQHLKDGDPISAGDLIANVEGDPKYKRITTGWKGLDHVFNGGLPTYGSILLAAESGTGKTTLMWDLLCDLADLGVDSCFISAEQTLKDIALQFAHHGAAPVKHMIIHAETDKDAIIATIEKQRPTIAVVDSVHTVEGITDPDGYPLATGGYTAVSQLGRDLKRLAGEMEVLIFVIGHMNNDGTIAGGATVRHMLDATLVMRRLGGTDDTNPYRLLFFEGKSRFGPLGRKALLEMRSTGLTDCGIYQPDVKG